MELCHLIRLIRDHLCEASVHTRDNNNYQVSSHLAFVLIDNLTICVDKNLRMSAKQTYDDIQILFVLAEHI